MARGIGGRRRLLLRHPRRAEMDLALQTERSLRDIAAEFGVNKDTLGRYKRDVLIPRLASGPVGVQARAILETVREGLASPVPAPDLEPSPDSERDLKSEPLTGEVVERTVYLPVLVGMEASVTDPLGMCRRALVLVEEGVLLAKAESDGRGLIVAARELGQLADRLMAWASKYGTSLSGEEDRSEALRRELLAELDPDHPIRCWDCGTSQRDVDGSRIPWIGSDEEEAAADRRIADRAGLDGADDQVLLAGEAVKDRVAAGLVLPASEPVIELDAVAQAIALYREREKERAQDD